MVLLYLICVFIFVIDLATAATIIFVERQNAAVTWAWLMVLLFIPIGGFVLYLIFGQHVSRIRVYKMRKRNRRLLDALLDHQREALTQGQMTYNDPNARNYEDLVYMNLVGSYAFYTQDNKVEIFTDGRNKFAALLKAIAEAKDHVHIEYYILRDDKLGQRLIEVLAEKAKEGVEVRLLYDAVGSTWTSKRLFDPLIQAGGSVAAFFPSKIPFLNFRMNHRNHRKLAIIDGRTGFIGGFNIGDEYLGLDERFGDWRDTHLRVVGSSVLEMQGIFLLDWNSASHKELPMIPRYFPTEEYDGDVGIQVVSSGPNSPWEQIRNAYIKMIYAAKSTVYIQTPYFIPDESLLTALKSAALSGIDVRLMLPLKPDHRLVYWASKYYLGELLSIGVKCYLYGKGFMHAKTMVIDGKLASVGTANIDIRSFKLNFEVNAMIFDSKTASELHMIFDHDLQYCEEWTLDSYRRRPHLSRIAESFARLLSPIL